MMNKKGMLPILVVAVVFVLIVVLVVVAVMLFQKKKDADTEIARKRPTAEITEPVRIDGDRVQFKEIESGFQESLDTKEAGQKITFELFAGETFECTVDEVIQEGPEVKGIICSSDRFDAYFTFDGEIVLGTITDFEKDSGTYIIVSDTETGKVLLEEHK
jgi:NADH:ubiquinone oxidoreductase subunit 3 (subunit A)